MMKFEIFRNEIHKIRVIETKNRVWYNKKNKNRIIECTPWINRLVCVG